MAERCVETPVGRLLLREADGAITRVSWGARRRDESAVLDEAERQLGDYFAGKRRDFDLPLRVEGSDFQSRVCAEMAAIPYGETRTYGDLAKALGVTAQAVGQACGGNPLPVLIPCHRVLGSNGLGGFSGGTGVETKVLLLRLEGAASLLI